MTQATLQKQAPPEAFRFAVPVLFAADSGKQDEQRISMRARSAGVVPHWYWGRIVHDMAGCRHKDRLPMDWRHDPDELLGYWDKIAPSDEGLDVEGVILSKRDSDKASDIIWHGRKGTPYEGSIYWDEWNNLLEYLDEGFTTTINGQQVDGPLVIVREWDLRGVSLTPYGVDSSTNAKFSAGSSAESIPVTLTPAKDAMSKTQTPAAEPTKDSAVIQTEATKNQATASPDATKDATRGELARYMQRFGNDRGAEYYRDSVPYLDACEREIDQLRKDLATKDSELAAERQKIASLSTGLGETAPVNTGAQNKDSEAPKPTWGSMFKKSGS